MAPRVEVRVLQSPGLSALLQVKGFSSAGLKVDSDLSSKGEAHPQPLSLSADLLFLLIFWLLLSEQTLTAAL